MKRVLVIVDVSNLYYSVSNKFKGQRLDYAKLADHARQYGEIYRAIAYGSAIGDQADKFKAVLRKFGFEPKYKEPKIFGENTADEYRKANWDVGMAMDIVKCAPAVDVVLLCSGDGDFAPCLEWIESQGKIAAVIGCGVSYELKNVCHYWTEIGEEHLDTYSSARRMDVRSNLSSDAPESVSGAGDPTDRT
jgi:uncharacterized LabA/DUF88 family protein